MKVKEKTCGTARNTRKVYDKNDIPPDTNTPSEFTAMQLRIALCPARFCMKFPSGNFHCLMLSAEAEAIVYLKKTIKGKFLQSCRKTYLKLIATIN